MPWSSRFPDPIPLPGGGSLRTLQEAGNYITKLPKRTHDSPPWQTAMHVLIQAADHDGPLEFARLGMMKALHPQEPVYDRSRKDPAWRNTRKLVRDR